MLLRSCPLPTPVSGFSSGQCTSHHGLLLIGPLHRAWLTFNWDDQLRKDWKKLSRVSFYQLVSALHRQEFVRLFDFADSFEEDRQMQVII